MANILLEHILSKPFAKVINRADTSRHGVIIVYTWVCPFPFLIVKINVLIAKIHFLAIKIFWSTALFLLI